MKWRASKFNDEVPGSSWRVHNDDMKNGYWPFTEEQAQAVAKTLNDLEPKPRTVKVFVYKCNDEHGSIMASVCEPPKKSAFMHGSTVLATVDVEIPEGPPTHERR